MYHSNFIPEGLTTPLSYITSSAAHDHHFASSLQPQYSLTPVPILLTTPVVSPGPASPVVFAYNSSPLVLTTESPAVVCVSPASPSPLSTNNTACRTTRKRNPHNFYNSGSYHKGALENLPTKPQKSDIRNTIKKEIMKRIQNEPAPSTSTSNTSPTTSRKRSGDLPAQQQTKKARASPTEAAADSNSAIEDLFPTISERIWSLWSNQQQHQDMYLRKLKLREALYAIMKGVFPYCGLYIVGSSMNGFGSNSSDMDMCLMLTHSEVDQRKEAPEILRIITKSLRKCSFLREVQLIKAKVPIIKFTDKISGVECDLNLNNSVGIRNTHLLNAYAKLDWRVSPLVLFTKTWAKFHNINDASQGTISSYSLVLMVIHFLQFGCTPCVLPTLQQKYPQRYTEHIDIRLLTLNEPPPPFTSENDQSLGELFVGLLHYYAQRYKFEQEVVSIRLGGTIALDEVKTRAGASGASQWKLLCIEEPFDLSNTARSVFDPYCFARILRVVRSSYTKVEQLKTKFPVLS